MKILIPGLMLSALALILLCAGSGAEEQKRQQPMFANARKRCRVMNAIVPVLDKLQGLTPEEQKIVDEYREMVAFLEAHSKHVAERRNRRRPGARGPVHTPPAQ